MSFDVGSGAYMRLMGRYSEPLAVRFADLAGVRRGQVSGHPPRYSPMSCSRRMSACPQC